MSDVVRIKYGSCSAVLRPLGAQIISFIAPDGREVIWQGDPAIWADHSPILFPVIGTVKDGKVIIDGVSYPMSKHGFAINAMFETVDAGDSYAVFELTESEETLRQYPFAFCLRVMYELTETGFRCRFTVFNRSDRPMPFCVGGHPGFIVPMEQGAAFENYRLIFPDDKRAKNLLCPGGGLVSDSEELTFGPGGEVDLRHEIFDEKDTLLLSELRSRSVRLIHRSNGRGLRMSWDGMEALAVWTMPHNHGDYICLEPWHGLPGMAEESGVFAEKRYATVLRPGECYRCGFEVELI